MSNTGRSDSTSFQARSPPLVRHSISCDFGALTRATCSPGDRSVPRPRPLPSSDPLFAPRASQISKPTVSLNTNETRIMSLHHTCRICRMGVALRCNFRNSIDRNPYRAMCANRKREQDEWKACSTSSISYSELSSIRLHHPAMYVLPHPKPSSSTPLSCSLNHLIAVIQGTSIPSRGNTAYSISDHLESQLEQASHVAFKVLYIHHPQVALNCSPAYAPALIFFYPINASTGVAYRHEQAYMKCFPNASSPSERYLNPRNTPLS